MATQVLGALSLITPELKDGGIVSVNTTFIPMVLRTPDTVNFVEVSVQGIATVFGDFSAGEAGYRYFRGILELPLEPGTYYAIVTGYKLSDHTDPDDQSTPSITVTLINTLGELVQNVLPPSGVTIYRYADSCKIRWATPTMPGFQGVRLKYSTDASGVEDPYVAVDKLFFYPAYTKQDKIVLKKAQVEDTVAKTITEVVTYGYEDIPYSEFTIGSDVFPGGTTEFYVVLSSVVQDEETKLLYESTYNGPFKCGFVNLRTVDPLDFPAAQTMEAITARIITDTINANPELDLSPRSELRDFIIDPVAREFSRSSVKDWFSHVSKSVSALYQLDDTDGDGISDSVQSSDVKLQLKDAFDLSDEGVQAMIDREFDILADEAGVEPRIPPTASNVEVTIYTTSKPTRKIEVKAGDVLGTSDTDGGDSITFTAVTSAQMTPEAADTYFDPAKNWWATKIKAVCDITGTIGIVGSGAIRKIISGVNYAGVGCINEKASYGANDIESNQHLAARIAHRRIVGVDSGTRNGIVSRVLGIPGVIDCRVIASGDLQMLRDWDDLRKKHVFGTVDVYIRSNTVSEQTQTLPYQYTTVGEWDRFETYLTGRLDSQLPIDGYMRVGFDNLAAYNYPAYAVVDLGVVGTVNPTVPRLNLINSFIDTSGFLNVDPTAVSSTGATNKDVLLGGGVLKAMIRLASAIDIRPSEQPVIGVSSVVGEDDLTGMVDPSLLRVVQTEDPLLYGGSLKSTNRVISSPVLETVVLECNFATTMVEVPLGGGVVLDQHRDVVNLITTDGSYKFKNKLDYELVPRGRYGRWSIRLLPNTSIPLSATPNLSVVYSRNKLRERVIPVIDDTVYLSGYTPQPLRYTSMVANTWLPKSHRDSTLTIDADPAMKLIADPALSSLNEDNRWLKVEYVVFNGVTNERQLMVRDKDYIFTWVDGVPSIARISGTRIQDKATVLVTYLRNEIITVQTQYPATLSRVHNSIDTDYRNGGGDILVKAMLRNEVDATITVDIDNSYTAEVIDRKIRTTLSILLENTTTRLPQSAVIRLIQAIPGVHKVHVPLTRFTKSDGSYDIGRVIPEGTRWISGLMVSGVSYPNVYTTTDGVLPYATVSSDQNPQSYVGLLYEGESYHRAKTLDELSSTPQSFYILGDRRIAINPPVIQDNHPGLRAYRVTYQIFGETGAHDLIVSPTEHLAVGNIVIYFNYLEGRS